MNLVTQLVLALARLDALGGAAPLVVEPPTALLGGLALPELDAAAGEAFGRQPGALDRLARALAKAASSPATRPRLAELAAALDTLLVADGALRAPELAAVELRLGGAALFHALRVLRLGGAAGRPPTLLVGTLVAGGAVELPLGLATPLDGLAVRYEAGSDSPHWRSELWLRVPPDPNKRRLADWPADMLSAARRIELYRQRVPGPQPEALIVSEPVPLPHHLVAGLVSVELFNGGGQLAALRSTVYDKFQQPLVVVERIVPQH